MMDRKQKCSRLVKQRFVKGLGLNCSHTISASVISQLYCMFGLPNRIFGCLLGCIYLPLTSRKGPCLSKFQYSVILIPPLPLIYHIHQFQGCTKAFCYSSSPSPPPFLISYHTEASGWSYNQLILDHKSGIFTKVFIQNVINHKQLSNFSSVEVFCLAWPCGSYMFQLSRLLAQDCIMAV